MTERNYINPKRDTILDQEYWTWVNLLDSPDKLYAELSYKDRMKLEFKENSMLYRFWMFLFKMERRKQ